jgi:hypothetical protein
VREEYTNDGWPSKYDSYLDADKKGRVLTITNGDKVTLEGELVLTGEDNEPPRRKRAGH